MAWVLHHRYAHPLSWDLSVITWDWALPLRVKVRRRLTDGSGKRRRVANIRLSLFCLHWDVFYAWGQRRYHDRKPDLILSLKESLEQDLATRLTPEQKPTHNDT